MGKPESPVTLRLELDATKVEELLREALAEIRRLADRMAALEARQAPNAIVATPIGWPRIGTYEITAAQACPPLGQTIMVGHVGVTRGLSQDGIG